jgi:hypothetical protein
MMRILFGLLLAVLLAVPGLLDTVLAVLAWATGHPPVLAFIAGVLLWPRLTATAKRWAR